MTEAEKMCERLAETSETVLAMVRKLSELDGQPNAASIKYEGCENIREAAAMIAAQAEEIVRFREALEKIAKRPQGQPDTALRVVSELSLIARAALSPRT